MTTEQMNEYIMNYLKNDKTKRAIMLDGPWGSGKSFYIEKNLKPFLCQNEHAVIVVSLYGISSISDISRSIYMNIRLSRYDENKESHMMTKIIAKTIITGVSSHWINLSVNEKDLEKLYKTIDLTGKLIVLEDLERSSIPILDVLGYVNNLTEQDEAKVMLVANEEEIINELEMSNQTEINQENETVVKLKKYLNEKKTPTQKQTVDYLRKKEKTVGDTIKFVCNKEDTIKNIFDTVFSEKAYFKDLTADTTIKKLADIMPDYECNWRSFLYACQKTIEIFDKYEENTHAVPLDIDFKTEVLIRTVKYCLKKDSGMSEKQLKDEKMKQKEYYNKTDYDYIDFVIEYIINQRINIEEVQKANNLYVRINSNTKRNNEFQQAFNAIYYYSLSSDKAILESLSKIYQLLKSESGIALYSYGKLLQYLMKVKHSMQTKPFNEIIDKCVPLMKENIDNKVSQNEIEQYSTFMWEAHFDEDYDGLIAEYNKHKDEMAQKIKERQSEKITIDYTHDRFDEFEQSLIAIKNKSYTDHCFLRKLDIKKFLALLGECSVEEIEIIRGELQQVYHIGNVMNDKQDLQQLCKGIKDDILKKELQSAQRLQFRWFLEKMDEYLSWLDQQQTY